MSQQTNIREEELKNRIATLYFGKYDCTRIVGNIDFCVLPKRRDPRQRLGKTQELVVVKRKVKGEDR